MADIFSKQKRSEVMSRIHGRGNLSTEMRMITLMRGHGIKGWRRHQHLPGRPDFVFRKERVAVFVDGCFWHGCPVHYSEPATSREFWREKISTNRRRDRRVDRELRARGWRVIRLWEHVLGTKTSAGTVVKVKKVLSARTSRRPG